MPSVKDALLASIVVLNMETVASIVASSTATVHSIVALSTVIVHSIVALSTAIVDLIADSMLLASVLQDLMLHRSLIGYKGD